MIRKFTFLRGLLLTLQNKIKKKEMLTGGRSGTTLTYQSRRGVGTWLVPVGRNNPPVEKRQEGFLQRVENLRRAALDQFGRSFPPVPKAEGAEGAEGAGGAGGAEGAEGAGEKF